jgi:hypothetical protein
MGPSRAVGAFIAVLISSALSDLARGGDLVECEPQRVTGDGRYWAYRGAASPACIATMAAMASASAEKFRQLG